MGLIINSISLVSMLLLIANQQCHCRHVHKRQVKTKAPLDCSLLANVTNPVNALYEAAVTSNLSAAHCLIINGVNVSGEVPGGFTPLQVAANYGHIQILQMLIEAGANVNVHDLIVGLTPLHAAVGRNFQEVALLLLNSGADVNAKSHLGVSPLQIAVTRGNLLIIELLINKGADLNAKDNLGNTPLHIAANKGKLAVVQMLVEKGADVNAISAFGKTPAEVATHNKSVRDFLNGLTLLTSTLLPQQIQATM